MYKGQYGPLYTDANDTERKGATIVMKLSARIILYHLRQKYKVTASPDLSPDPCLEYPLLWTPGGSISAGKNLPDRLP